MSSKFELLEEIGHGKHSHVFLGIEKDTGNKFALNSIEVGA